MRKEVWMYVPLCLAIKHGDHLGHNPLDRSFLLRHDGPFHSHHSTGFIHYCHYYTGLRNFLLRDLEYMIRFITIYIIRWKYISMLVNESPKHWLFIP